VAIADGGKAESAAAVVNYRDSWDEGLFRKSAKLDWLVANSNDGDVKDWTGVERGLLDDFRPTPFQNGEWLSIREAFLFSLSGVQTKRDKFAYAPNRVTLQNRIMSFLALEGAAAVAIFHPTGARPFDVAQARLLNKQVLTQAAYRPFDIRWLCNDVSCIDRPRPELQAAWGQQNLGLYSLKSNTGARPDVWCHGLLPDYHAIKGSNGGYAFPLYDRREGPHATNLSPVLIASLGEAYGQIVAPEDVFDAILALLSATSYTRRFAEDLEDVFPHIPFPATQAVFARAVDIGHQIRTLESFSRDPDARFRPASFCRLASEPDGPVASVSYRDEEIALCENGSGRITGIPQTVWDFAVSGYRVLPRWIDGRKGLPADLAFVRELRDVAARIAELIHWFDEADIVLNETLADTLTREELGFPAPAEDEAQDDD
jgi:hypothetical protein